jgi:hypothetical protein
MPGVRYADHSNHTKPRQPLVYPCPAGRLNSGENVCNVGSFPDEEDFLSQHCIGEERRRGEFTANLHGPEFDYLLTG